MLRTAKPVLYGWNDYNIVKPEVKVHPNDSRRSDDCWILLIDGSIKEGWYWETGNSGSFGIQDKYISHWAYKSPPQLPEDFKPK